MSETNLLHENPDKPSTVVNGERRREDRLSVNITVEITGIDRAGHLFHERTFVENVTDVGCRFDARTQLQCGDIVAVKPLEPGEKIMAYEQPQLFEVMWAARRGTSCTVGTRKLQGEKLATVKFPPPNCSAKRPSK